MVALTVYPLVSSNVQDLKRAHGVLTVESLFLVHLKSWHLPRAEFGFEVYDIYFKKTIGEWDFVNEKWILIV